MPTLIEVEEPEALRGGVESVHLVLQHRAGEVPVDGVLPRDAAPRRPPPVGDEDGEPLIREPLGLERRPVGVEDLREVWAAVRIHDHREGRREAPLRPA